MLTEGLLRTGGEGTDDSKVDQVVDGTDATDEDAPPAALEWFTGVPLDMVPFFARGVRASHANAQAAHMRAITLSASCS